MKVLSWSNLETPVALEIVPAPITDYSHSYADDKLYSYYNTSFKLNGGEIYVNLLTDSLVKIQHSNGEYGYFAGFGINRDFFKDASEIFFGYGEPKDIEKNVVALPVPFTRNNGQEFIPFYVNIETANQNKNRAYLIVVKHTIHFHFTIDTSTASMLTEKKALDPILWKAVTVPEMIDDFMFGINLADTEGNPLPDQLYIQHLNAAVQWLETILDICITERDIKKERQDYYRDDYVNWGYIQVHKTPVKEVTRLDMMWGNQQATQIPLDWIQLKKIAGQITLFPQSGSASTMIIGQTGLLFGLHSPWNYGPAIWELDYKAGIDENDPDMPINLLKEAVYKRAVINVMTVWGNVAPLFVVIQS